MSTLGITSPEKYEGLPPSVRRIALIQDQQRQWRIEYAWKIESARSPERKKQLEHQLELELRDVARRINGAAIIDREKIKDKRPEKVKVADRPSKRDIPMLKNVSRVEIDSIQK